MCAHVDCDSPALATQRIPPRADGARPIDLTLCTTCDFLVCKHCKATVFNRTSRNCPNGHRI